MSQYHTALKPSGKHVAYWYWLWVTTGVIILIGSSAATFIGLYYRFPNLAFTGVSALFGATYIFFMVSGRAIGFKDSDLYLLVAFALLLGGVGTMGMSYAINMLLGFFGGIFLVLVYLWLCLRR